MYVIIFFFFESNLQETNFELLDIQFILHQGMFVCDKMAKEAPL